MPAASRILLDHLDLVSGITTKNTFRNRVQARATKIDACGQGTSGVGLASDDNVNPISFRAISVAADEILGWFAVTYPLRERCGGVNHLPLNLVPFRNITTVVVGKIVLAQKIWQGRNQERTCGCEPAPPQSCTRKRFARGVTRRGHGGCEPPPPQSCTVTEYYHTPREKDCASAKTPVQGRTHERTWGCPPLQSSTVTEHCHSNLWARLCWAKTLGFRERTQERMTELRVARYIAGGWGGGGLPKYLQQRLFTCVSTMTSHQVTGSRYPISTPLTLTGHSHAILWVRHKYVRSEYRRAQLIVRNAVRDVGTRLPQAPRSVPGRGRGLDHCQTADRADETWPNLWWHSRALYNCFSATSIQQDSLQNFSARRIQSRAQLFGYFSERLNMRLLEIRQWDFWGIFAEIGTAKTKRIVSRTETVPIVSEGAGTQIVSESRSVFVCQGESRDRDWHTWHCQCYQPAYPPPVRNYVTGCTLRGQHGTCPTRFRDTYITLRFSQQAKFLSKILLCCRIAHIMVCRRKELYSTGSGFCISIHNDSATWRREPDGRVVERGEGRISATFS
ncbi:hypothetical protein J6590_030400 [Homalodisca vitripennis]|nr:hypothetical protein J6590_030400 [Homalodisca vitripennis]